MKQEHSVPQHLLTMDNAERQTGDGSSWEGLHRPSGQMQNAPPDFLPSGNDTSCDAKLNDRAASAWWLSWSVIVAAPSEIIMHASRMVNGGGAENADTSESLKKVFTNWAKIVSDIIIAVIVLMLLAPIMIATALMIRITMGSPVIFAHERIGKNGVPFRCFKFRTMVNNSSEVLDRYLAEHSYSASKWRQERKLARDPRVTGIGRLLRRSSIDELPQLFNVLRGEMSCVGPRPVVADELASYGEKAREYISVRPGMTGLWQVSGRSSVRYADRVNLDTLYVRRWSMLLDLAILLKTIPAVMKFGDTA